MMQVSSHHLEALRTVLAGKVITAEDADYDTARIQWNNDIDRNPLAIARCVSPADIAAALTFAREQELGDLGSRRGPCLLRDRCL